MAALALWACSPCFAVNLSELLLSARARDPAYAIAKAQADAAHQRWRQARAGMLPVVNFTASATQANFDEVKVQDRRFSTELWAYQLTQPLVHPVNNFALAEAQYQERQAQAQLAAAESDLAQRVATAWFDVLSAQEVLRAIGAQKEASRLQLTTAQRSFELGSVSIADVREAQAKHAVVEAQEAQADSDLLLKRATLGQIAGRPVGELSSAEWMKPDLMSRLGPLDEWLRLAREGNPTIAQASHQLVAAGLEVGKARAGHAPSVDFTLNYSYDNASGTTTSRYPSHNKTLQYGVQLTVPIFAGFGTDAKVGEAVALREKAKGDLYQSDDQVLLSVKQAYYGLRGALYQLTALETAQAANAVAVRANLRGYQVGMRTNVDVLNAQAQLYQTEKDLAKARTDAWLNYIRLRILSGRWSENDLHAF
ncbi:TolC family outer membrane protein [Niveibacterium terrae]|uniref:TolC family outer membrane protein n=1 Tax=Niveibacterium terrae TaxID=3373598 RepID=UPI003A94F8D0